MSTDQPKRHDWQGFQELCRQFFEKESARKILSEVTIDLASGPHRFDLVSGDGAVVIEVKSYTWTKSGNRPSAKWEAAQRAAALLTQAKAECRLLIFQDDYLGAKSLAKEFKRLNQVLLSNIEVWRRWNGSFEKLK